MDTVVGNIAEEAAKDAAEDTTAGAAKATGEASTEGASGGPASEAGKPPPRKRWWVTSLPSPQPRAPADI